MPNTWRTPSASSAATTHSPPVRETAALTVLILLAAYRSRFPTVKARGIARRATRSEQNDAFQAHSERPLPADDDARRARASGLDGLGQTAGGPAITTGIRA